MVDQPCCRFLSNEAKHFGDAEVRCKHLRVGDGRDLAAGIQPLRKSRDSGIRVGRDARIVLVVILQRQSVLGVDDPVEIADRLIGDEICGSRNESVFREVDRRRVAVVPRHEVLAVGKLVLKDAQRNWANLVGPVPTVPSSVEKKLLLEIAARQGARVAVARSAPHRRNEISGIGISVGCEIERR